MKKIFSSIKNLFSSKGSKYPQDITDQALAFNGTLPLTGTTGSASVSKGGAQDLWTSFWENIAQDLAPVQDVPKGHRVEYFITAGRKMDVKEILVTDKKTLKITFEETPAAGTHYLIFTCPDKKNIEYKYDKKSAPQTAPKPQK